MGSMVEVAKFAKGVASKKDGQMNADLFVFAEEGAQLEFWSWRVPKKPFETRPFLSGFGINWQQKQWLWHALAPPNKAKRKGLQRHGRRCQVCHRSRLKEAKKLSESRIPIGFFLARLWNALAPPKNQEGKACKGAVKGAEFSKGAASKIDARMQAWC